MSATWLTHLEHQWRSLAWKPWLEALSRDHTLLRYDSRGCGLSDRGIDNLSFETWIKDFEKVIDAVRGPYLKKRVVLQSPPETCEVEQHACRSTSSRRASARCSMALPAGSTIPRSRLR